MRTKRKERAEESVSHLDLARTSSLSARRAVNLKMDSSIKLCNVVLEKYFERPEELDTLFKMMLVLNGLFSFTAVLGNLSIIFGLKKASSIPSLTQILLKCLAVTDLGNGVVGHPLYLAVISGLRQSYTCENNHQILLAFFLIQASLSISNT